MKEELRPRVVVVTGASAGIARAAAVRFGARGDKVALVARGEAGMITGHTESSTTRRTAAPPSCGYPSTSGR